MHDFETSKLRGRIIEKYGSQKAFAKVINKAVTYVSNYLNGHRTLKQQDIAIWAAALDILPDEIDLYFFTLKVHEMEQKGGR